MPFAILYWILWLVGLVLGLRSSWPVPTDPRGFWPVLNVAVLFALLFIIGWTKFGPMVHQ